MLQKSVPWLTILLIIGMAGAGFAASDDDVILRASELMRTGRVVEAEGILSSASAASPDSLVLHGALGKVLFKEQKYEDAVRELGLVAQASPDSREYNMLLAEALMGWQHFQVAIDFLQAIQPRFDQYPEFHYDLGFAFYSMNKVNEATAEFEQTLRLAPTLDRAEFLLASCLAQQGETAKALAMFRKLAKEHPSNEAYWVTLGEYLGGMGRQNSAEALNACRRALRIRPGDAHAEYITATVLLKNEKFAAARPIFEKLEKLNPKVLEVHVDLARIYARLDEPELSRREAEVARKLQREQNDVLAEWQKRKAEFEHGNGQAAESDGLQQH